MSRIELSPDRETVARKANRPIVEVGDESVPDKPEGIIAVDQLGSEAIIDLKRALLRWRGASGNQQARMECVDEIGAILGREVDGSDVSALIEDMGLDRQPEHN